jgi:hypothetical protein
LQNHKHEFNSRSVDLVFCLKIALGGIGRHDGLKIRFL